MNEDLWLLASICLMNLVALISPGPNFVMVTQMAMQRDRAYALMVGLGVATGTAIWGIGATAGVSSLSASAPWLHVAMRYVGGVYLISIGIRMWMSRGVAAESEMSISATSLRDGYFRGLTTNLLNPKAAAYYVSAFALFFGPSTPRWVQVAAVLVMIGMSVLWHAALATVFSMAGIRQRYFRAQKAVNRIAGAVIGGFGLKLLMAR